MNQMSKLISEKKIILKPLKSLNKSEQNINQFKDESISYTPINNNFKNNHLLISNDNNNITIDYLKHFSPINRPPISLPPIQTNFQKPSNSHKKTMNKKNKIPKKLKYEAENSKINNNLKLNAYIKSERKSEENKINFNTIDINNIKKRDNFYSSLFSNYKQNNNINGNDNFIFINRLNKKKLNNIKNFYSPNNSNIIPKIIFENKEENLSLINNNKNKKNIINEIIKEKIENQKEKNFSLPAINNNNISKFKSSDDDINNKIKDEKENNIITVKEENKNNTKEIDYANIDNIDTSINFLKDLTTDKNNTFINFLILIQTHLDIGIFFDSLQFNNNINSFLKKKQKNDINIIAISNFKLIQLKELLNTYFNTLTNIYTNNPINDINDSFLIDSFFLFPLINKIFHKCLKIQICLFSIILITLNQLTEYEINLLIKNYLIQLFKQISIPILIIYDNFIKEEINLKYPDIFTNHLKSEFNDNFKKLFQLKKFPIKNNCNTNTKLIEQISKDLDKCIHSLQYYSNINIKNSDIKIFADSLNQMLNSIDTKTLNQFAIIFLDSLIYSQLEQNHKKINIDSNSVSSIIKDYAPYLPDINPKYKYTLVLDMDETLVHFFFTKNIGMFFIRPYCLEFLNQLNEFYEIITFTAGTKEYAEYILNILDPNNEKIKYRLYRQHVTILGSNVYKDLSKLGRDLNKVIIIDNMKENFKMQPNNGLYVKTWINDINDYQLKDLLKLLKDIVLLNVPDVRPIIQKINEKNNKENNLINPYYNINVENIINEIKL